MQLQCMDSPTLQLGLPLNLLTTSPSLLTFLLFTLPQPFFLLLQEKLHYAMLLLFSHIPAHVKSFRYNSIDKYREHKHEESRLGP